MVGFYPNNMCTLILLGQSVDWLKCSTEVHWIHTSPSFNNIVGWLSFSYTARLCNFQCKTQSRILMFGLLLFAFQPWLWGLPSHPKLHTAFSWLRQLLLSYSLSYWLTIQVHCGCCLNPHAQNKGNLSCCILSAWCQTLVLPEFTCG